MGAPDSTAAAPRHHSTATHPAVEIAEYKRRGNGCERPRVAFGLLRTPALCWEQYITTAGPLSTDGGLSCADV